MKTVYLISRHSVVNYGSLLQSFALQKAVEELGYEAKYINYRRNEESPFNLAKNIVHGDGASVLRVIPKTIMNVYRFSLFNNYVDRFLNQTCRYSSASELARAFADKGNSIYCTGSDQVWNIMPDGRLDPAYFLSFIPKSFKKISYSASFGSTNFSEKELSEIHRYLEEYDAISIREDTGRALISSFGLESTQVIDPTGLIEAEIWSDIANKSSFARQGREEYFFVYSLHGSEKLEECVGQYKTTGIKEKRITFSLTNKSEDSLFMPKPEDFLSLIKEAKFVITDSFHGTMFCLLFNVPFIEVLPDKYNDRNLSMLKLTGLVNRISDTFEGDPSEKSTLDFDYVNERLSLLRRDGLDFLENSIINASK